MMLCLRDVLSARNNSDDSSGRSIIVAYVALLYAMIVLPLESKTEELVMFASGDYEVRLRKAGRP